MSRPDPHRIEVSTAPGYVVHVGQGLGPHLVEWLEGSLRAARYALVTDTNVAATHAKALGRRMRRAGLDVLEVVFDAGEAHKTRETKQHVEDRLLEAGLGRDAAIVSVGGGVVTDLAGFTAATFLRGIPHVPVPTTLLGMVDASIGGKTGVDHPRGKNLIGAFHQPAAVFADVAHLEGLGDRQFRSGLAEAIKAAVIRDGELLDRLVSEAAGIKGRDPALLAGIIARACAIKAEVVSADEKEGDLRKILNFGHTIGHAVEKVSGYKLTHGEAISIGMAVESRIAVKRGLLAPAYAEAIRAALEAFDLPVALPSDEPALSPEAILA
ncbi:MAG: 3-dehydroquinate synthase, partial [Acidobacteriota bacterium]